MRKLYIIRHAKSDWTNSDVLLDIDRPLNSRGVRDSYTMASRLNSKKALPSIMLSSNGIRALHTAIIMAKELKFKAKEISVVEDLFHCSADEILKQINEYKKDVDVMFLFAHNPGISNFANKINIAFEKVPTCSILEFSVKSHAFRDIKYSDLSLVDFDYPKKYNHQINK